MALPKHKYYSLEKAAQLAGCEVSDLIHFASIGVLQICIKAPLIDFFFNMPEDDKAEPVKISVESSSTFAIDEVQIQKELAADKVVAATFGIKYNPEDGVEEEDYYKRWLRFTYRSEYFSVTEKYEVTGRETGIEKWSGFLAIPSGFIEYHEQELSMWDDWELFTDTLIPPRCESNYVSSPKYKIGEFYTDEWYDISRKKMYITDFEFRLLIDGGKKLESDQATTVKSKHGVINNEFPQVNKQTERFALNRENLFKSAIYILSKYPEECRGERKEISPEKWRDCLIKRKNEVPPLMITNEEVILKHLRKAVNGKDDSKMIVRV